MTNANSEPPVNRMLALCQTSNERLDLERKVLAAAFKLSFDSGESEAAALAHKGLCAIIQQQLFSGDSSSGSVIPASIWQQQSAPAEAEPQAEHAVPSAQTVEAAISQPAAPEAPPQPAANEVTGPTADNQTLAQTHEPGAGPAAYLDFGEPEPAVVEHDQPSPEAIAEMLALSAAAPPQDVAPLTPSQLIKRQSFYQILAVNKLSSFEEIHTRFLRLVRKMLRTRYASEGAIKDMREFREVLRAICVAHDVLKDPITRADYDFRQLGMRNSGQIETPADTKPVGSSRTRLMIGELLECSNILEPAELQVALDMHRAEPGQQFGEFLVTAGFLNQEELDSALLGQRLISAGKITVAQFQTAMYRMRDCGAAFFDTLMVEGWITPRDIFDESSVLWENQALNSSEQTEKATPNTVALTHPLTAFDPMLELAGEAEIEPESNGGTNGNGNSNDAEMDDATKAIATARKALDFDDKWTEKDACADTQTMDVTALRAALGGVEENKD